MLLLLRIMESVRPCRSTSCPDEPPSLFGSAEESQRISHAYFYHCYQQQEARDHCVARLCPLPNHLPGMMHTAAAVQHLLERGDNRMFAAATTNLEVKGVRPTITKANDMGHTNSPLTRRGSPRQSSHHIRKAFTCCCAPSGRCMRWGCPRLCYHHGHKLLSFPSCGYHPPYGSNDY